tara:strand:+ start:333 stop:920 length:588 start_codon:yes stop_codon:yes gene_type:complete
MADLKVINPNGTTTGPDSAATSTAKATDENNAKALEIEKQIEETTQKFMKKKYRFKTDESTLNYLMTEFYANVSWEGYECYAISETNKELSKLVEKAKPSKTGKVGISLKPEILEAVFHFVKKHSGTGLKSAMPHRMLCEHMSIAMAELNNDRAQLRDMAMEAEAAKHGISVEDYKKAAAQIQNAPQGAPQPNLR